MFVYYILLITALVLQLFTGNLNPGLFSFPVNLLVIVFVLYVAFAEWRKTAKKKKPSEISSSRSIIIAIASVAAVGIILLIVPQFPEDIAVRGAVGRKLGLYSFTASWIFSAVMVWFLIVLASAAMRFFARGTTGRSKAVGTAIAGVWLALAALTIGGSDATDTKVAAFRQFATNLGNSRGRYENLPVMVKMNDFGIVYGGNGKVESYSARVEITSENGSEELSLTSGAPARYGRQKVYLVDYDREAGENTNYCVIRMLRRPWEPVAYAGIAVIVIGAVMYFVPGKRKQQLPEGK